MSKQYKHVSLAERVEIEKLLDLGRSQAEIARRLGRSRSTISREVKRRSWRPSNTSAAYTPYRQASLRAGEQTKRQYRATIAQGHADRAARRSHQARRMRHDRLVDYVHDHLRRGWTPEEIAGRLPLAFPDDPVMRVSHETLYAWIYSPVQRGLALWQYLARGQRKRRKRGPARKVRRAPQIRYRIPIHQRPAVIEDRAEFGHWEADSVLGASGTG
ncbi:IS30 family transposase, partial [Phytoactinopolyspora limicola]|uniref:IS30 family transposase n=1 Tax=Phytoactinopolyspora limicola TaxID=2715536 RepID=UPI001407AEA2